MMGAGTDDVRSPAVRSILQFSEGRWLISSSADPCLVWVCYQWDRALAPVQRSAITERVHPSGSVLDRVPSLPGRRGARLRLLHGRDREDVTGSIGIPHRPHSYFGLGADRLRQLTC